MKGTTKEILILKPNTTTDKFIIDIHADTAYASRNDIEYENNSDFVKLCLDLIVEVMSCPVIWCSKLQPCTTCTILFPTKFEYTAPAMSLQAATSSTAVTEKISNGFNLLHHKHLTFKATIHENITSSL